MSAEKIYWTTKNGNKINVDDMTEDHLRNTLKMIIRNIEKYKKERIKDIQNDEPYAFDYLWK